jgi:methylated-DNA-[protein]-cysteine S-methyltransferase
MDGIQKFDEIIDSPVGFLGVKFDRGRLSTLTFLGKNLATDIVVKTSRDNKDISKKVRSMLDDYFVDPRNTKQPGKVIRGTEFQKNVWHILSTIKPGQTRTYGDIARQLKSSPRAVGNACRRNPVPIFIPCHRVVSASGRGGFMGQTKGEPLKIKEWLLAHEQKLNAGR